MKWSGKIWLLVFGVWLLVGCGTYSEKGTLSTPLSINIIPQPQEIIRTLEFEFFSLRSNNIIYVDSTLVSEFSVFQKSLKSIDFIDELDIRYLKNIPKIRSENEVYIFLNKTEQENPEEYTLRINEYDLVLESNSKMGISRGLQSIYQLILLNKENGPNNGLRYLLPIVSIKDFPKFKHRGLLLDCSRHFFEKEVVKKYIDLLAFYKMNVLHWHLTEDQGWRIAIDKYPKLTEIGAWRTELNGEKYGGFYTKDEIREIVAYAQERHITVIPEIELPGHSQAAIAAYPHLSCTGEQVDVANDWGVFKEIYCAGNDSVFTFLEDVLTEVMELFPSEYIHIGGDEAPKFRWDHCKKCQQRIKDEDLKDEHGLQSYFISRMEKFLNKNGRQLIGWDEILEGGLSENATVQSWRGMEGGITAANSGHNAIMSPTSHAYFDYDLKAIDLKKVYSFNPIPAELAADKQHFIIGGECNLWSEHVPDEANLDSKVFPRLLAMSEVLWSGNNNKNYTNFNKRVQSHYKILDNYGVKYGEEAIPMTYTLKPAMEGAFLKLHPYDSTINLKHRFSCTTCDTNFIDYKKTIHITKSVVLQIQPYKNDKKYGNLIEIPFANHLAINKNVDYTNTYSKWYTAGGNKGLVDSKLGSLDFRDGAWQGFYGEELECILNFDGVDPGFSSVSANFYQYNNSWIFIPKEMSAQISVDGKIWEDWGTTISEVDPKKRGKFITTLIINHKEEESFRYLKLKVKNIGKVPDWHEAAGSKAWLFIDEIIVK